jgi:ABC-type spermidine/putrescine transport system permease subunit II
MGINTLVILEQAVEPYRRAGFIIASQSERAITLVYPRAKFNYLFFLILLLIWPLALLYLISFNHKREQMVCLRVTSEGRIEADGYTLAMAERDRRREQRANSIILAILIIVMVALVFLILHLTGNL